MSNHNLLRTGKFSLKIRAVGAVVILASVASGLVYAQSLQSETHVAAYFQNSIGLYEGDRVMLRGVPVGAVSKIEPAGDQVKVEFSFDSSYPVPADARAAIVAPTLVTGRYIQLSPTYVDGATLGDGAEIPLDRTVVPVEYDEVRAQLDELVTTLGPDGLNGDGSVSRLLDTSAQALDGNGFAVHDAMTNLSDATETLKTGAPDLFGTVKNLQVFVSNLSASDRELAGFSSELSSLSHLLNNNRTELDAALNSVVAMLPRVEKFVSDNRGRLTTDVSALTDVTRVLAERQDEIAQTLHVAPTVLADLYNIYDPDSNSLTGALAAPDLPEPVSLICALLTTVDAPDDQCVRVAESFGVSFDSALKEQVARQGIPALPVVPAASQPQGLADLLIPTGGAK
ncbi:MCE family protein [Rhodococcus sp. NPDC059968]|uniref:MCE family protein n=1 Tax=Rhodococcus sp. NPDC059968 TaxID=3347017 RepID=UPI0036722036